MNRRRKPDSFAPPAPATASSEPPDPAHNVVSLGATQAPRHPPRARIADARFSIPFADMRPQDMIAIMGAIESTARHVDLMYSLVFDPRNARLALDLEQVHQNARASWVALNQKINAYRKPRYS